MSAPTYTPEEWMSVVISREVRDDETTAVGTLSPIPTAGVLLARERHAAHGRFIVYKSDYQRDALWPFRHGSKEFYDFAQQGRLDLFFVSAAQIDQHGNLNLNLIGSPTQPTVRLPGGAGTPMLWAMVRRIIVFKTEHSPRVFVPHVDFITCPGRLSEGTRAGGGLAKIVTPLAVLSWHRERHQLELESVTPGNTPAEVQACTGFPLGMPGDVPQTPTPSEEELRTLRTTVRQHLAHLYPQFVASSGK